VGIRHVVRHVKTPSHTLGTNGTVLCTIAFSQRSSWILTKIDNGIEIGTYNHIEDVAKGQQGCIGKANKDVVLTKLIVVGRLFITQREK
jgi:hypothetical protein